MTGFPEYDRYDGLGLGQLVRRGEVKPIELVEEAISRIERLNPKLNAVINKMYDQAREIARGPLPDGPFKGVPFLLKDWIAFCAGEATTGSCRFLDELVPNHDSEMVKRYKAAGTIVLGKTNLPEFGLLPVTESDMYGAAHNPWDLTRNTGGSSGGSAAAVATRMVPLAHGNDGGGSIRIPSSCCGVFGLKPTRGRVPTGPDLHDVWYGLNCDHVLTRSVRDSAAMLDASAGPDPGAPYFAPPPPRPFLQDVETDPGKLRIAFTSKPFIAGPVHPDCLRGLERTVQMCRDLGHELVEASPPVDASSFAQAFYTMVRVEASADLEEFAAKVGRPPTPKDVEVNTWAAYLMGKQISGPELSLAIRQLRLAARQVGQFFEHFDVLLTPTLADLPWTIGALQPKPVEKLMMRALGSLRAGRLMNKLTEMIPVAERLISSVPFTLLFNITGQPAMSVPLHWNAQELPIGMQFVGRYADESTLFRLAAQLEKAKPWANRIPPLLREGSDAP